MVKRLDDKSRDILQFRPKIAFVEPDVISEDIPIREVDPQLEEVEVERDKLKKLAKAVNILAAATQARADQKAKGMKIALDPGADSDAIQAMRRAFPDVLDKDGNVIQKIYPTEITYDQYKKCKDHIREKGEEIVRKPLITPDEVSKAKDQLDAGAGGGTRTGADAQIGGFGTPESRDGRLRPELDARSQIIEPIDMIELQDILLKILINFLWKKFIVGAIPLPPGVPGLPDKLVEVASLGLSSEGISVPGEKEPKKQEQPEIPQSI